MSNILRNTSALALCVTILYLVPPDVPFDSFLLAEKVYACSSWPFAIAGFLYGVVVVALSPLKVPVNALLPILAVIFTLSGPLRIGGIGVKELVFSLVSSSFIISLIATLLIGSILREVDGGA